MHSPQVFFLRSMLAVPYFEKALYELPEERVTPDELKALADETERRIQGGLAGRCGALALRVCRMRARACTCRHWEPTARRGQAGSDYGGHD